MILNYPVAEVGIRHGTRDRSEPPQERSERKDCPMSADAVAVPWRTGAGHGRDGWAGARHRAKQERVRAVGMSVCVRAMSW